MIRTIFHALGATLLILMVGSQASAQDGVPFSPLAPAASLGTAFTYQGRLTNNGSPATGSYDIRFQLYNAASGGAQVGSNVTKTGVQLNGGLFTVSLDFGEVFDGAALWLQVAVRPAGTGGYTTLSPRQPLSAAPYALGLLPGASVAGTGLSVLTVTNTYTGPGGANGIIGKTKNASGAGVLGDNSHPSGNGAGVLGYSTSNNLGTGVLGWSLNSSGTNYGVFGRNSSPAGFGGYFENQSSDGVALYASGSGATRSKATLRVDNYETNGGMAAYLTNSSNFANTHIRNSGSGQVLWLQNGGTDTNGTGGGDFITAINNVEPSGDIQFRVLTSGEVRSDVGFNTPAADFAEMLPASPGLEPGDVLVIGPDGKLARSTLPYQSSVVGVYSTRPGFLGGQPVDGELDGHVPLALVGVVPVKASAENGPIQPGDLLTASSIPGHAMRCVGVDRCFGRTLGKALEGLASGTGVIQMLVILQ